MPSFKSLSIKISKLAHGFLAVWLLLSPLLAIAPLSPKAAYAAATLQKPLNHLGLQNGLVGWYTFDGPDVRPIIKDRSSQGNNGAVIGMATTTTVGKIGQALRFDGNGAVYADNVPLPSLTIAMWIKFDDVDPNGTQRFFDKNTTAPIIRLEDGNIQFVGSFVTGATEIESDRWYHVAVTGSSSGQSVYVNGALDAFDATAFPLDTTDFITIGGSIDTFAGVMDEVRIYNRALSASEIFALYSTGGAKFASSADTTNGTTLESGLVGHWTFDGKYMTPNVRDTSGQGNHGDLVNQSPTTTVPGKIGQAWQSFDATTNRVSVPAASSINDLPTLSVSAWVYPFVTNIQQGIIAKNDDNSGGHGWKFQINNVNSRIDFFHEYDSGTPVEVNCNNTVTKNEWQLFSVTWDGSSESDNIHVYKNGVEVSCSRTDGVGNRSSDAARPIYIGNGRDNADQEFNGYLDDVRVYNRQLSATEISTLYSTGAAKFASSNDLTNSSSLKSGLVGHWTFDGKYMTPNVRDSSGQGYHASLLNQSPTTTTIGKIGQALRFDGNNDYITNLGSGANTSAGAKNTVAFWMYWEGSTDSEVFGWGEGVSPNRDYSLWIPGSGACFGFNTTNSEVLGISTTGLSGRWVHVAAVFHNGTPSAANNKLYIDGVAQSISYCAGVGSLSVTAGSQFWAGSYRGVSSGFLGKMDDLRIYNRELSASEVNQLYNLGR